MVAIGVVIVNYKSSLLTCRCIASLKECVRTALLTYIVVDNSPESEIDDITALHPDIVGICSIVNEGFAGGCNIGIRYACRQKMDYIQLINPDVYVEQNFIGYLIRAMQKSPHAGMAAPKILYDNPSRNVWYGGGRMNWWLGGPVQIFDRRNDDKGEVQSMPFLSGCAMLLRTTSVSEVGTMDESYFLYYEDADYVQRFIKAGFGVVYVPEAEVLHKASATVGFHSFDYVYYFSRNRIKFMRRWAKWYHFAVYMLYNTFVKLPGAVFVFGVLNRRPRLVLAYFKGYIDGISCSN